MKNDKAILFIGFFIIIGVIFALQQPIETSYVVNEKIITEDYIHGKIERGEIWYLTNYTKIDKNDEEYLLFYTGPEDVHLTFIISNKYEAEFIFLENITVTNNGTKSTYFNRNRNYVGEDGVEIYFNGTLSDEGHTFGQSYFGGKRKSGGEIAGIGEFIFRSNTTYALKIVSKEDNNLINFNIQWYEAEQDED